MSQGGAVTWRKLGSTMGRVGSVALLGIALLGVGPGRADPAGAPAGAPEGPGETYLRPEVACPLALSPLMAALLRDLPSYANRVASRSLGITPEAGRGFGTVLLAGAVDLEPLNLSDRTFGSDPLAAEGVQQVFFTTLERQYSGDQMQDLQHYHWLFLSRSETGWHLVLMYSSLGGYPAGDRPPSPPRESSHGIVGQAVQLWLRDCRAGAIYPPASFDSGTGE